MSGLLSGISRDGSAAGGSDANGMTGMIGTLGGFIASENSESTLLPVKRSSKLQHNPLRFHSKLKYSPLSCPFPKEREK